jgi:hypothetical protein
MILEDRTLLLDDEFLALVAEAVRLTEGLEGGDISCACRRYYRLGLSPELKAVLPRLRMELARRMKKDPPPAATSRFAWLEVDNDEEK